MIFEEFYKILTKINKFWKNNFLKDKKKNYIRIDALKNIC